MQPFTYLLPRDWDEASDVLSRNPTSSIIAGGTNLVDLMKLGVVAPDRVVDIRGLLSNEVSRTEDGGLHIGAGVTNARLASNPDVRRDWPLLSQAILAGASGQIRNTATVGGNLLQRTRCVYFQDTTRPCNKREPGSGCSAINGVHRDMSILGQSPSCIATNPSDMAVAFTALDAVVEVRRIDGQTVSVSIDDFYRLPGDTPEQETVLQPGEVVTAVKLPPPLPGASTYRKVRDRASYAFALVSVAGVLDLDGSTVSGLRLAFGALAPKPWRARLAEEALIGLELSEANIERAMATELAAAASLPGNAFKIDMAATITREALLRLGAAGVTQ